MQELIHKILDPFLDAQTYKNIAYLFASFPLGIFYFVFLTTGLSLAFSLLVVLVGFPILLFVMALTSFAAAFERQLANSLLDTDMEVNPPPVSEKLDLIQKYFNQGNLKGLLYLFLKFPLGIMTFILSILLVAMPFGFILGPFFATGPDAAGMPPAPISIIIGLLIGSVSLPILNKLAEVWRDLTISMLGKRSKYVSVGAGSTPKAKNDDPYFDTSDYSYAKPVYTPPTKNPPERLMDYADDIPDESSDSLQQRIADVLAERNHDSQDEEES